MNRFENMRSFVRVVEAGSISAAADRLGMAKSVVSRRLKELESHLGVELFHRTTRSMNLTDTGRAFYHQSVRILDDLLEAEAAASQAHTTLQGRLKIALPSSFGLLHMTPALNDFLDAHPHIEFDLDFNDREVDLIQEGFDLAIRIARLPDSSLIARRLAPINMVLCASPDYLQQHGEPQHPDELSRHRCLTYSLLKDPYTWSFIDTQQQQHNVPIRSVMQASAGDFLKQAAIRGHGLVYLPTFLAYEAIETGELLPLMRSFQPEAMDAYAIYPPTRHLSQRVRALVDFLAARFAGTPYWDECLE
ncbi:MAG: LysR family transcriptional regulator [Thiotrichales bacterium]